LAPPSVALLSARSAALPSPSGAPICRTHSPSGVNFRMWPSQPWSLPPELVLPSPLPFEAM
jgi:hypothetical protein